MTTPRMRAYLRERAPGSRRGPRSRSAAAMRPFMGPPTTGDPRRSGGFLAAAYGARQKLR